MKTVLHQILGRSGFSPVTKRNYGHTIDRWIEFAGADPAGWTPDKAQEFYDQLVDGGLSVRTVNVYMDNLHYVSKWYAKKTGGIDFAIVQRQRGTKGKKRVEKTEILDEAEVTALLQTCRDKDPFDLRDLAMIVMGLETGMRRMSLQGLEFEGLNNRLGYPAADVPIKGAGGEERFNVPVSNVVQLALSPWLDWLSTQKIATGFVFRRLTKTGGWRGPGGKLVVGDSLTMTGINEIIEARARAAGIRHVNPHLLRHTFITSRMLAGYTPMQIAAITGHQVNFVIVDGTAVKLGAMSAYMHPEIEPIRNSTPAWLRMLIREILK